MAERRMFAKAIVNSARFLRMPPTSRLLYYDLGMAADDDGIVEAFTVMRTTGATDDDLRVLVAREFITILNEDLVSLIVDWKRNNLIKNDRYHKSVYSELLVQFQTGTQLKPDWNPDGIQPEPDWNPDGIQPEPEVRLDKVRLDKDRLGKCSGATGTQPEPERNAPTLDDVMQHMQSVAGPHICVTHSAERFWNYNNDRKWSVCDWQAAAANWIREDMEKAAKPANSALNYEQRQHTEGDFKGVFIDLEREYGEGRTNEQ